MNPIKYPSVLAARLAPTNGNYWLHVCVYVCMHGGMRKTQNEESIECACAHSFARTGGRDEKLMACAVVPHAVHCCTVCIFICPCLSHARLHRLPYSLMQTPNCVVTLYHLNTYIYVHANLCNVIQLLR